jgi:hypothetical protein
MPGRGVARRSNSRDGADVELRHSWVYAVRYVRGGEDFGFDLIENMQVRS